LNFKDKTVFGSSDGNGSSTSNWQDTIMCSLGIEYKYTDKLSLLGGWQLEPSPYPQDRLTLLGTDQYSFNNFYVGGQYSYNSFKVGLTLMKSYSKTISQNGTSYSYDADVYRLTVGYTF